MNSKVRAEREYGVRHLRPNNLSELRKDLRTQLGALRAAARSFVRPTGFAVMAGQAGGQK